MREIQKIVNHLSTLKPKTFAVATLVEIDGSSYRSAGARMLISSDTIIGAISGGCLEQDIIKQALEIIESGGYRLITYDNTDLIWGLGTGCGGKIRILIEKHDEQTIPYHIFFQKCFQERKVGVAACIYELEGQTGTKVGQRLLLREDGTMFQNLGSHFFKSQVLAEVQSTLQLICSKHQVVSHGHWSQIATKTGLIRFLVEPILPSFELIIFGAGYDTIPLAIFADQLGWKVTLVDHRPAYARAERYPSSCKVIEVDIQDMKKKIVFHNHMAALVMTHNFQKDLEYLRFMKKAPLSYLGVLGPQSRTERLLKELANKGITIMAEQTHHLFSPAGLDIGAETCEEIALSILSEIQAVIWNRTGGFLRERQKPLHDRNL